MTLVYYPDNVIAKFPEIFETVQTSYWKNLILYVIDRKYSTAVNLRTWINSVPTNTPEIQTALSLIASNSNYDLQVINVLRYVQGAITYKKDSDVWKVSDKWQTPTETLQLKTGDCEDGAILIYTLCRLKGVPVSRLLLFAGDVNGGGHCWLAYKGNNYPLNYVFLDWCYWYNASSVAARNKFYVDKDSVISECDKSGKIVKSNYYKAWFGFNHETSIKNFKYNPLNRYIN